MEVLYVGKEMEDYVFMIVFLGIVILIALLISFACIHDLIKGIDSNKTNIKGMIASLIVAILIGSLLTWHINQGAEEYKKVIITDFNELHGQGYKIVEQEGKIYKIVKE